AVRKPARGRADIRAVAACGVHLEGIERVLQLLSAAGDEAGQALDGEVDVVTYLLARLRVAADEAGEHERLCLCARGRQTTPDEEHVEALRPVGSSRVVPRA